MTIQKFRNMDLIFLSAVAIVSDLLLALFGLIGIRLFLSIAYPLIVICYIRWSYHGILPNLILMVTHLLLYGIIGEVGWPIAILHSIATLGFASMIILIKLFKQEKSRISTLTYLLMYVTTFFTVFMFEWSLFNIFGYKLNLITHGFNHVLNFLFGFFIIFITSRQKDILTNMRFYFINKDKEV